MDALREYYLQDFLDGHIERELPKVRSEIKSLLASTETQLANLGDERPSTAHMRMFLTRRRLVVWSFTALFSPPLMGTTMKGM